MKRIVSIFICVLTISVSVFSHPIKAQASYAVPAGYGVDFIRALYSLFETVLIATGIAQGVDNYSECDSLWEAFTEFVDDITPNGIEVPETGEKMYLHGCIQFEECQVQIYQGKWYVYGYDAKDMGGGIYWPDCYAIFDNYYDFLEYMGCPVELPNEETWREWTVLEGGKGDSPEPSPEPELEPKLQIAFTAGTIGIINEFVNQLIDKELEVDEETQVVFDEIVRKSEIYNDSYGGEASETAKYQTGLGYYDYYTELGFPKCYYNGSTLDTSILPKTEINGVEYCVLNGGFFENVLDTGSYSTYHYVKIIVPSDFQGRVAVGFKHSNRNFEIYLYSTNSKAKFQEYYYRDDTKEMSLYGGLKSGWATSSCMDMYFDIPVFSYSSGNAKTYINSGIATEPLNYRLYVPEKMIELAPSVVSALMGKIVNVNDLKNINQEAFDTLENVSPETNNALTDTETISDAISDAVNDAVQNKGEVILPAPEFYPEIEPNPEIVSPETQPDAEPTAEPTAEPDSEPTSSPDPDVGGDDNPDDNPSVNPSTSPDVGGDTGDDSQIETEPTAQPTSPPQDLTEDMEKYKVDLTTIFPFCLPFDLMRLFDALDAEPATPSFTFPFVVPALGINMEIPIDLSWLDSVMIVFRLCMRVSFILGLIYVTGKVIKW